MIAVSTPRVSDELAGVKWTGLRPVDQSTSQAVLGVYQAKRRGNRCTPAAAVDQICVAIDAGYWNWDEEGYHAALLELDEAALTLIGDMWRAAALHEDDEEGHCGLCGPLYDLFNSAVAYSRYGEDPEIAARFRDLVDEGLHEKQIDAMEAAVELAPTKGGAA